MENYLFYAYLKYVRDNQLTLWPKLLKLPKDFICLFIGVLVCVLLAILFIFFQIPWLSWLFIFGEVIFCVLLWFFVERYQIKVSEAQYDEYKQYCIEFLVWLEKFDLKSADDLKDIQNRMKRCISSLKEERQRNSEQFFKWLQSLIIPVIIAVITTLIANQTDISNSLAYVSMIMTIFIILCGMVSLFRNIFFFPKKRMCEQMECFVKDLQGALDCQKYVVDSDL